MAFEKDDRHISSEFAAGRPSVAAYPDFSTASICLRRGLMWLESGGEGVLAAGLIGFRIISSEVNRL